MHDQYSCQFECHYPISGLNSKHLEKKKLSSVYDDNIFPSFFCEFNVFSIKNIKIISNFKPSHMTKHVSKAGKEVKLAQVIG